MTHREKLIAARTQRDAKLHEQYGHGTLEMDQCPLCGLLRMSSLSHFGLGDHVIIREMGSPEQCSRCDEIMRRAPEIFRWILGVAANTRLLALALEDDKP